MSCGSRAITPIQHGFEIDAGEATGPEFFIKNTAKIWMEAIAPGPGHGPDAVPELEYGRPVATKVPSEEIILRLRHAIWEKHRKYVEYLEKKVVASDEPYIIAINSRRIRPGIPNPSLPFIVQSVFPLGNQVAIWDKQEKRIVDSYHSFRDSIQKKSGATVSTDIFLDPEYAGISAVCSSRVDMLDRQQVLGSDFILVHNPLARNPLPLEFFKFGIEYWKANCVVKYKLWTKIREY